MPRQSAALPLQRLTRTVHLRVVATVLGMGLTTSPAGADQCLTSPARIAGLGPGPEWTDFDADGFWRPELHDPRWAGAPPQMLTHAPGVTSPLLESGTSVRVRQLNGALYVAVYVDDDSDGPTRADTFHLGVADGDAAHVFEIELACNSLPPIAAPPIPPGSAFPAAPADPDPPRVLNGDVVKHWYSTNARAVDPTWTLERSDPTPDWASWMNGACWDRATTSSPRWAVTLRIDLPKARAATRDVFLGVATTTGRSPNTLTVLGNVSPASGDNAVASTLVPKSAANWERFTADVTDSQSPCRHALTVNRNDLGVWIGQAGNPEGGRLVDKVCVSGACGTGDNVLRVIAKTPTRLYSPWEVRARFRVSDWGSTPDTRDFGTWQDVWTLPDGTQPNSLTVDSSTLAADPRWHFHATPSRVTIDFECSREDNTYCPRLQSGNNGRQAFLVELVRNTAGGSPMRLAWALRNIRYEDLSVVDEQAAISVAGLEDILQNKDPREVYLQVIARNLPAHDSKPQWLPTQAMDVARRLSGETFAFEPEGRTVPESGDSRTPSKRDATSDDADAPAKRALAHAKTIAALAHDNTPLVRGVEKHEALAMTDDQLLDAVWPTFRVRPYYVRARQWGANGEELVVLVPMPAFGLRLTHDGPLYGFSYTLEDESNNVMAPINGTSNWYKMTIPNEGRRNVRLGVVAEEEPKLAADSAIPSIVTPTQQPRARGCSRCDVAQPAPNTSVFGGFALLGLLLLRRSRR